jgi:hypothetical protein
LEGRSLRADGKFDVVISNPPYQKDSTGYNTQIPPIYHKFMEDGYKIAEIACFITPARFLFNAGATPKAWNKKMLEDEHLKVEFYEQDSSKVFANVNIRGGVAITYRDGDRDFGGIRVFVKFPELNGILSKVKNLNFVSFSTLISAEDSYRFSRKLHDDNPNLISVMSKGHEFCVSSNVFDIIPEVFYDDKPQDNSGYVRIYGREKRRFRKRKWIRQEYIRPHKNLYKFKLLLPRAFSSGTFVGAFPAPIIAKPGEGHTATFISAGAYSNQIEAENVLKYIKSKFARALLGILKVTQQNTSGVWKYVPLQNFTAASDIDWSKSAPDIDRQLYEKYGLDESDIEFIEAHIKEIV